jgi:hypothetical protein
VEVAGFAKEILEVQTYSSNSQRFQLKFDLEMAKKGLVIDKNKGNVLQLDNKSRVVLCFHGSSKLSEEEIVHAYGVERHTDFTGIR